MSSQEFKKRVLFLGIPDMAYICLEGLFEAGVNIVGVVGPKKNHATFNAFKHFVLQRDLNFINYDDLKNIFFINKIKALKADIAVVCSFNYKVPKALLESVKDGFINVHPSLLPKYRGPNPYSRTILNGEKETGVTLHFMDENFDTGDIITQRKVEISDVETMGTLFNRTNVLAFEMLFEILKEYELKELPRYKQPEGNFELGNLFQEDELVIDFDKPAKEIDCLIRALNPFVLARTNFRQTLTKILTAEVVEQSYTGKFLPGEIVKIENDKIFVSTGEGLIAFTSMQFGSFFAGTSKEFIKILGPKIGEKFE